MQRAVSLPSPASLGEARGEGRGVRSEGRECLGVGSAHSSSGLDQFCPVVMLGTRRPGAFFLPSYFFLMLKVVPELKSFHLDAAQGRSLSSFQLSIWTSLVAGVWLMLPSLSTLPLSNQSCLHSAAAAEIRAEKRPSSRPEAEGWWVAGRSGRQPQISMFIWSSKHPDTSQTAKRLFCACLSLRFSSGTTEWAVKYFGSRSCSSVTCFPVSHEKHVSAAP